MNGPSSTKSSEHKSTEQAEGHLQQQAPRPGPSALQAKILAMQRAVGNRSVAQLLQAGADVPGMIPAKRTVGQPGDKYEQEEGLDRARVAEDIPVQPDPQAEYFSGDFAALKQLLEGSRLFDAGQSATAYSIVRTLTDAKLQAIARDWGGDLSLTLAQAFTSAEWVEVAPRLGPYVSVEALVEAPLQVHPGEANGVADRYEVDAYLAQDVADLETAQVMAQTSGRLTLIVEDETGYDVAALRLPPGFAPGTLAQIASRPQSNVIHPEGMYPVMLVTADGWRLRYRSSAEFDGESLYGRWHVDLRAADPAVLPALGSAAMVANDPMGVLDTGLREFVLARLSAAAHDVEEAQARFDGGSMLGVSIEELDTIRSTAAALAEVDRRIAAEQAQMKIDIPVPVEMPQQDVEYSVEDIAKIREAADRASMAREQVKLLVDAQAATLTLYPMLAHISDLEAFTAMEDNKQVAALAATLPSVGESIKSLQTDLLHGSIDLWDFPKIVEAGLNAMGITDAGLRKAAKERYQWEGRKELATDLGLVLLGLVLGLGAAFAPGGWALGFAGAALVVDTGDALRLTARADLQQALANSNVDPAQALVPGDLSGRGVTVWLAWAGVVLDTVQLVQVARAVERGMEIAEATRLVAKAEGLDPAELTRLRELASTTFEAADDPKILEWASKLGVLIVLRPSLQRGVWVTFATDALGGVKDIAMVLGGGATEAELLGHVATVQRLQEWVGAAGWVRGAWARARGQVRAGQLGFEAVLELEKLDALVQVRRVLLEKQPLGADVMASLEHEIDDLARQREGFADLVDATEEGTGVIAAKVAHVAHQAPFTRAYTDADALERFLRSQLANRREKLSKDFIEEATRVLDAAREQRIKQLEGYKAEYNKVGGDARDLARVLRDETSASLKTLSEDPKWGSWGEGVDPLATGKKIIGRESTALRDAVKRAIGDEVFGGRPILFRGSASSGQRGEQKGFVPIDPLESDVDLYNVPQKLDRPLR